MIHTEAYLAAREAAIMGRKSKQEYRLAIWDRCQSVGRRLTTNPAPTCKSAST